MTIFIIILCVVVLAALIINASNTDVPEPSHSPKPSRVYHPGDKIDIDEYWNIREKGDAGEPLDSYEQAVYGAYLERKNRPRKHMTYNECLAWLDAIDKAYNKKPTHIVSISYAEHIAAALEAHLETGCRYYSDPSESIRHCIKCGNEMELDYHNETCTCYICGEGYTFDEFIEGWNLANPGAEISSISL